MVLIVASCDFAVALLLGGFSSVFTLMSAAGAASCDFAVALFVDEGVSSVFTSCSCECEATLLEGISSVLTLMMSFMLLAAAVT